MMVSNLEASHKEAFCREVALHEIRVLRDPLDIAHLIRERTVDTIKRSIACVVSTVLGEHKKLASKRALASLILVLSPCILDSCEKRDITITRSLLDESPC